MRVIPVLGRGRGGFLHLRNFRRARLRFRVCSPGSCSVGAEEDAIRCRRGQGERCRRMGVWNSRGRLGTRTMPAAEMRPCGACATRSCSVRTDGACAGICSWEGGCRRQRYARERDIDVACDLVVRKSGSGREWLPGWRLSAGIKHGAGVSRPGRMYPLRWMSEWMRARISLRRDRGYSRPLPAQPDSGSGRGVKQR